MNGDQPPADTSPVRSRGRLGAFVRLLRLPSVATVPGDVLVGAAWAQDAEEPVPVALPLASSLLYLGGMALNDWADREVDAIERPRRPIPAGEIAPSVAFASAAALTGSALLVIACERQSGKRWTGVALAGAVWLYDLRAKDTASGPWTMSLARTLDVMLGARSRAAAPAACVVGAHALLITRVSAKEAQGGDQRLVVQALASVAATTLAATMLVIRRGRSRMPALACLALYAAAMAQPGRRALREPEAAKLQALVGAGVLANMPLQAALLAGHGRRLAPVALVATWPFARRAARKAAVT